MRVTRIAALFHALLPVLLLALASPAMAEDGARAGIVVTEPAAAPDMTITSAATGKAHPFSLELAITPEQWQYGLMFRDHLAADHGMLFVATDNPRPVSFWMRNTLIELDMLFIGPDWRLINIHKRARPHDLTPIPSGGVVIGVVEIRGGQADALGLKAGDKVTLSPAMLQNMP